MFLHPNKRRKALHLATRDVTLETPGKKRERGPWKEPIEIEDLSPNSSLHQDSACPLTSMKCPLEWLPTAWRERNAETHQAAPAKRFKTPRAEILMRVIYFFVAGSKSLQV